MHDGTRLKRKGNKSSKEQRRGSTARERNNGQKKAARVSSPLLDKTLEEERKRKKQKAPITKEPTGKTQFKKNRGKVKRSPRNNIIKINEEKKKKETRGKTPGDKRSVYSKEAHRVHNAESKQLSLSLSLSLGKKSTRDSIKRERTERG